MLFRNFTNKLLQRNVALALSFGSYNQYSKRKFEQEKKRRPVYLWGSNAYGLVEPVLDGTNTPEGVPAILTQPRECDFWSRQNLYLLSVAGSERQACAVDSEGNLWQWGEDAPQAKGGFPMQRLAGKHFTKCLTTDQMIFAINREGILWAIPVDPLIGAPVIVSAPERISSLACGHDHLVAVGSNGALMTGLINDSGNWYGQLGIGIVDSNVLGEEAENGIEDSEQGDHTTKAVNETIAHDWPREDLSLRKIKKSEQPPAVSCERRLMYPQIQLQTISQRPFRQVAGGSHHTLAVDARGVAYAWGANSNLQLGLGANANPAAVAIPTPVPRLPPVKEVAAAGTTSFFHTITNHNNKETDEDQENIGLHDLYACGNGLFGQLGIGGWHHAIGTPTLIPSVSHQRYYDERLKQSRPLAIRALWAGPQNAAVLMDTFHPDNSSETTSEDQNKMGYDLLVWGSNKYYQLSALSHANLPKPQTLRPPSPKASTVDDRDLALSKEGPTAVNPTQTISFIGGQLQILPCPNEKGIYEPAYQLYMGSEFCCFY